MFSSSSAASYLSERRVSWCWAGAPAPPEHSSLIHAVFMASVHTLPGCVNASVCLLWGGTEPDDSGCWFWRESSSPDVFSVFGWRVTFCGGSESLSCCFVLYLCVREDLRGRLAALTSSTESLFFPYSWFPSWSRWCEEEQEQSEWDILFDACLDIKMSLKNEPTDTKSCNTSPRIGLWYRNQQYTFWIQASLFYYTTISLIAPLFIVSHI